jgi:hypothetical protein
MPEEQLLTLQPYAALKMCRALSASSMLSHRDLQNSTAVVMAVACTARRADEPLSALVCAPLSLWASQTRLNFLTLIQQHVARNKQPNTHSRLIHFLTAHQTRDSYLQQIYVYLWTQDKKAVVARAAVLFTALSCGFVCARVSALVFGGVSRV